MDAMLSSLQLTQPSIKNHPRRGRPLTINRPALVLPSRNIFLSSSRASGVISCISADTSVSVQAEISWQIVIGALAGVTPFVVAGIEFSKRIVAQRKCEVCKGSGLVLRDNKYYIRCPACGGFLPWQSWRRFFTG